ncbi:MAG: hypothetical protein J5959_18075, partial [Butyrivibrio sp.]|nr:hypothetical protein [Butyrivibrio sp.]
MGRQVGQPPLLFYYIFLNLKFKNTYFNNGAYGLEPGTSGSPLWTMVKKLLMKCDFHQQLFAFIYS